MHFLSKLKYFHWRNCIWKRRQPKWRPSCLGLNRLTHWGRVTHICVNKLIIIGSDNGLSPGRRQAIIWTNAGISLTGPLWTNSSEILIGIQTFSFKKMHLKMSSAKWRAFCLGLNDCLPKVNQHLNGTENHNQRHAKWNHVSSCSAYDTDIVIFVIIIISSSSSPSRYHLYRHRYNHSRHHHR